MLKDKDLMLCCFCFRVGGFFSLKDIPKLWVDMQYMANLQETFSITQYL